MIGTGHSLNLKVLVEGVETEEQLDFLRTHHCDQIQGFYVSTPLEADALAEKLRISRLQPDSFFATKLLPAKASEPAELEDMLCAAR